LKAVTVPGGTRLSDLSKTSGIPLQDLIAANPHLLNKRVPATSKPYPVWVPAESAERATASQTNLPAPSVASRKNDAEESSDSNTVEFHRVARGETLTSIAHEYGIPLKKLRKLNGLTMPKVNLRIGQKIKISGPMPSVAQTKPTKRSAAVAEASNNTATKAGVGLTQQEYVFYRVRSGDNLNKIGKRFGVGAEQIKEANSLGRNELYAGELIRVPATGG
jgi:N-acetylmuramoyl-L-alanine amidase